MHVTPIFYGIIAILFAFVVYRTIVISRIPNRFIQEGLSIGSTPTKPTTKPIESKESKSDSPDNSAEISSMIDETGKQIKIVNGNGTGQKEKLASMNTKIDFINKELDKKINGN